MLEVVHLRKSFGSLIVTDDVSLSLAAGAREAVIGPNGAGKTTLFNLLSGELRPDAGAIRLGGRDITGLSPDRRVMAGLARSFQRNNLFMGMTVAESLATAVALRSGEARVFWRSFARAPGVHEKAARLAERVGLADRLRTPVRHLSYGSQRQL